MRIMKSILATATVALSMSAMADADWKTSDFDLGTYEGRYGDKNKLWVRGGTAEKAVVFSLSQDNTISPMSIDAAAGNNLLFDFASGGNHTLSLVANDCGENAYFTYGSNFKVTYLGGVWDFNELGNVHLVGRASSGASATYENTNVIIDGAKFRGVDYLYGFGHVNNCTLMLTNGAEIVSRDGQAGEFYLYVPRYDANGNLRGKNNRLIVGAGCKLQAVKSVKMDSSYQNTRERANCSLEFIGPAAELKANTSGTTFQIGAYASGYTVRFDNYASGYTYDTNLGVGSGSCENRLTIENHSSLTNSHQLHVGTAVNSDSNVVEVLNGSECRVGVTSIYQPVYIGKKSCYNRMIVSNSTVTARHVVIGVEDGANYNEVRFCGEDANYDILDTNANQPFGAGQYNRLTFDNFTKDFTSCGGILYFRGTNNTIAVDNQSTVTLTTIRMGEAGGAQSPTVCSAGNTLFVGDRSVLQLKSQFLHCGHDCSIVISNGTMSCDNQYSFYIAQSNEYTTCEVARNRVVFQGSHPWLTSESADSNFSFSNDTVLRFEIPPTGYTSIPITCSNFAMVSNLGMMEFAGFEEYRKGLTEDTDVVLAQIGDPTKTSSAFPWALINRINASGNVPEGCTLSRSDANGQLIMKVSKPKSGFLVIIR